MRRSRRSSADAGRDARRRERAGDGLRPRRAERRAPSGSPAPSVVALPFSKDDDDLVLGPGAAELLDEHDVDLLAPARAPQRHGQGRRGRRARPCSTRRSDRQRSRSSASSGSATPRPATCAAPVRRSARRVRGRDAGRHLGAGPGRRRRAPRLRRGAGPGLLHVPPQARPSRPHRPAPFVLAGLVRPEARERRPRPRARHGTGRLAGPDAGARPPPTRRTPPGWPSGPRESPRPGVDVTVWDEKRLAREGFGGHPRRRPGLRHPAPAGPRSTTPRSAPAARTPHVVLVGKGITFDTGGLSIKPAEAMMNMKRDMTGAGVVLAVMAELAAVDCPVRVTGLLACAENAVGGNALRPGDVIRHYGGRTSEVTNTDAEGRLVLADALAYAVDELAPDRARRRRDADRRDEDLPRASAPAGSSPPTTPSPTTCSPPARRPGSRCGGCRWSTTTRSCSSRPIADADNAAGLARARSPRRCSCATSSATCPGRTSTSPRWATRRSTPTSGPPGRPASAPGSSCTGWSCASRWPASAPTRREGMSACTV